MNHFQAIFLIFFSSVSLFAHTTAEKATLFDEMEELSRDRAFYARLVTLAEREKVNLQMANETFSKLAISELDFKTAEWKYLDSVQVAEAAKYNLEAQDLLVNLMKQKTGFPPAEVEKVQKKRLELKLLQAKARLVRTKQDLAYRTYVLAADQKLYDTGKAVSLAQLLDAKKFFVDATADVAEAERLIEEYEKLQN